MVIEGIGARRSPSERKKAIWRIAERWSPMRSRRRSGHEAAPAIRFGLRLHSRGPASLSPVRALRPAAAGRSSSPRESSPAGWEPDPVCCADAATPARRTAGDRKSPAGPAKSRGPARIGSADDPVIIRWKHSAWENNAGHYLPQRAER